jgi:hypothetical protein
MDIQENKKSPDVELDTDGVQEQLVEVEEQKVESTEPELPREEVDLGYTEPKPAGIEGIQIEQTEEKQEAKKTAVESEDDLADYSDSVKKRIDKLTRRYQRSRKKRKSCFRFC